MKITDHDKKILLVLLGFVVLALVYFNVYTKQIAARDAVDAEVQLMQVKLAELKDMDQQKDRYLAEIEKIRTEVQRYSDMLPVQIKEEDSIMFARELEQNSDMTISNVGVGELEMLSSTSPKAVEEKTPDTSPLVRDDVKAVDEALSKEEEAASKKVGDAYIMEERILYRNVTSLNYQSTYAGLKSAIQLIGNNKDRTTIDSLNASFDTNTGNLSGTLLVNQYSMSGAEKQYEAPNVPTLPIGTDNIFGTVEIPVTVAPVVEPIPTETQTPAA